MAPTLHSLLRADRELFLKMAEQCRQGITIRPDGSMPLDVAMNTLMFSAQVSFHLLPLPGSGANRRESDTSSVDKQGEKRKFESNQDYKTKRNKGGDKGGGKGGKN